MHNPKDISEAYLLESSVDIQTARLTHVNGLYSRTIHFAQEAVEKIAKSCLASKGIYTRDHKTSTLFKAVFTPLIPNAEDIYQAMLSLEKHGARARFPLYQRTDLPLWVPSKVYGDEEAKEALAQAELVFNTLKGYLDKELDTEN
ncbi:HEPN domain-containing protein [bacterium]|nr:HEPN domain-containing protein [bacterium]